LASLGHPSKFQRLSRLGFVTAATSLNGSQPNFARCLAISWAGRPFIHFRQLLPRNGIMPGAKFTLRPPSVALSYIGSVTAQHSSSVREPNFAALSTWRRLYSAGRPSRWALAHILVFIMNVVVLVISSLTWLHILAAVSVKQYCPENAEPLKSLMYYKVEKITDS